MSMSTGTGTAREPALISFLTRFLTRFLEDHFYVRSSARPEPCRDRPHRREEWTHRYEMMRFSHGVLGRGNTLRDSGVSRTPPGSCRLDWPVMGPRS